MTSRGAGAVDVAGTTLWLSYLIRPDNAGQAQRVALMKGTGSTYSDSDNAVRVSQSGGTWHLVVLTNDVDTGVAVTAGQTYLVVVRAAIGGAALSSTANLWINPSTNALGGADPDLGTATASFTVTNSNFKFGRLHWYPGSAAGQGSLDEVRLGTTFAAITPVPPPAVEPDADADGLPDWWETEHYGSATGGETSALASNRINTVMEAFVAGIAPTDPNAFFAVAGFNGRVAGNVLQWQGVSGRVYAVSWATNLMQGFQSLSTDLPWDQVAVTDTTHAASAQVYYRIDVQMEP